MTTYGKVVALIRCEQGHVYFLLSKALQNIIYLLGL